MLLADWCHSERKIVYRWHYTIGTKEGEDDNDDGSDYQHCDSGDNSYGGALHAAQYNVKASLHKTE